MIEQFYLTPRRNSLGWDSYSPIEVQSAYVTAPVDRADKKKCGKKITGLRDISLIIKFV